MEFKQMSMFDGSSKYKIEKPIRLIELFAGYGSQHLAFNYLGVKVESYKICEWAIKSIQAYKDLHFAEDNTNYSADKDFEKLCNYLTNKISANYSDSLDYTKVKRLGEQRVRKIYNNAMASHNLLSIVTTKAEDLQIVDTDKYTYVMTYSFPCQDLSKAGLLKGMAKGSGTRSGLLWEVERLLYECNGNLPQVLVMENVPTVVGTKNLEYFNQYTKSLEQLGYKNHWEILNAKDFGIPQNRRRCFMVSILGDYLYDMPMKMNLKYRLKDLLEDNVEEKYFISDKMIKYIANDNKKWTGNNVESKNKALNEVAKKIKDTEEPQILDCYNRKIVKNMANTIQAGIDSRNNTFLAIKEQTQNLRIRKLTPRECFRLMGMANSDINKIEVNQVNIILLEIVLLQHA